MDANDIVSSKPTAPRPKRRDGGDVALLQRIEMALARIEDGHFGYCSNCGTRMEIEALEEDPTEDTCHVCRKDPD